LDGRRRGTGRKVSCRTGLVAELPAGLLVNYAGPGGTETYSALLKANGSVVRFRDWLAQPVVGNLVLSGADRRTPLLLHDMQRGRSFQAPLARQGRLRPRPGRRGTGGPAGDRRVRQVLPLVPKDTDVGWTTDGRVVILASNVLAVWRPGEPQLSVRRVNPTKEPGSEFIVW
jgi:hypothetical protein